MEKYIVHHGDKVIACIFDDKNNLLRIGGNQVFRSFMLSFITEYLEKRVPVSINDRNKVRYFIHNVSRKCFEKAKETMENNSVIFLQKKSLERIMR